MGLKAKRNLCYLAATAFGFGIALHTYNLDKYYHKREEALEQRVERYESSVDYYNSKLKSNAIGFGGSLLTAGLFIGIGVGYNRRRKEEEKK